MGRRAGRRSRRVGAVLVLLGVLAGCGTVPGRAVPAATVTAGVDPSAITGTDGGDDDRLAAATLRDLDDYWGRAFPALAGGRAFVPPRAVWSVDTSRSPGSADPADPPPVVPPCADRPGDLEGNASYCPAADVVAYDRTALLPVLRQDLGDAAVVVVLAHEYGHVVAERLGGPDDRPEIVAEGQADCYGGAFLRRVRDGDLPDLRTGADGVDAALGALVRFRDPAGRSPDGADAHGGAFDRVAAFQDGFADGPARCAAMSAPDRRPARPAVAPPSEGPPGGQRTPDDLTAAVAADLDRYLGGVVTGRGGRWATPVLVRGPAVCPGDAGPRQGPVAACPGDGSLHVDPGATAGADRELGDGGPATLLAARAGVLALAALGRPTTGPAAGRSALCLAGAWTAAGADADVPPAGDLDAAVELLLRDDAAARGADGASGGPSADERVAALRRGVDGGADACLRAG